jgi:hypothetical protein
MRRFWYDPEYGDQHRTSCYKDSADDHPRGKNVAKNQASEEGIPKQGDSSQWREDDDRKGGNLNQRADKI